mgnify:CR=1 FL=1
MNLWKRTAAHRRIHPMPSRYRGAVHADGRGLRLRRSATFIGAIPIADSASATSALSWRYFCAWAICRITHQTRTATSKNKPPIAARNPNRIRTCIANHSKNNTLLAPSVLLVSPAQEKSVAGRCDRVVPTRSLRLARHRTWPGAVVRRRHRSSVVAIRGRAAVASVAPRSSTRHAIHADLLGLVDELGAWPVARVG